jgi:hypothetical protein
MSLSLRKKRKNRSGGKRQGSSRPCIYLQTASIDDFCDPTGNGKLITGSTSMIKGLVLCVASDPDDSTPNAGDNPAFSPFSVLCALFPRRCTACVDRSASGEPPVPFPPGAGRCERILGWTSKNPPPPGKPGREKWYNKSVKRIVRERRFAEVGRSSRFFRSKGRW